MNIAFNKSLNAGFRTTIDWLFYLLRLLSYKILVLLIKIIRKFNNNWINLIYKWRHLPPLRSLASCVDGDAWVFIARSLELTAIKLSLSSPINYYQATFYYSSSKRRKHVKYIQTYWLKFQWRISNSFNMLNAKIRKFKSLINVSYVLLLNFNLYFTYFIQTLISIFVLNHIYKDYYLYNLNLNL